MRKLFLYLASRSKQGIKLVTVLKTEAPTNAPLKDLKSLNLTPTWEFQIQKLIEDHKMLYEPIIESANSYAELRQGLKDRGFTNLPTSAYPLLNFSSYDNAPVANNSSCTVKKTMTRKIKG